MNNFVSNFLSQQQVEQLLNEHEAPLYVYSAARIAEQAHKMLTLPAPFGLSVHYAMKANPHPQILQILKDLEVKIDASSGFEVEKVLAAGFAPQDIILTSQELAKNFDVLVRQGVQFTACSLRQLEEFGKSMSGGTLGVRINPGVGSGHSQKTNVGGVSSSFGIWHEYIPKIQAIAQKYNLTISRVHTHIGSGTDVDVWRHSIDLTLGVVEQFPSATHVDVGGGFKVGRLDSEKSTNSEEIGELLKEKLLDFAHKTGRKLHLEVEPGTFLVANAGILLAQVEDIVDTGEQGYKFIKLNTGMNDILRPSLYAAQHPIAIVTAETRTADYVVVGHCCESGDLLTPDPNDPEKLATRELPIPQIGDAVLVGGCGAYVESMAAHGYNSFPRTSSIIIE